MLTECSATYTLSDQEPSYSITMIDETWLPVVGYPDYSVSDLGRVRSESRVNKFGKIIGGRILKPMWSTTGYQQVNLGSGTGKVRTMQVHRLVMAAFVGPCPAGHVVKLKDKRGDPRLENLEYSRRTWLHSNDGKLTEDDIKAIRSSAPYFTQKELADEYGVHPTTISLIIRRKTRWDT